MWTMAGRRWGASLVSSAIALTLAAAPGLGAEMLWRVKVNGMVCSFCAQGIKRKLSQIPGIANVSIDMQTKTIRFGTSSAFKGGKPSIQQAIRDAGYVVQSIEETSSIANH